MIQNRTRLRRLIADEIGECCEGDVEKRLDDLEALAGAVPEEPEPDLWALKTLGDGTRHELARLLVAAEGELCVCELAPLVDVSESAVSHALSDLAEAGLVTRRKEGTWRYYDATDRARALLSALDATRDDAASEPEGATA
ncbi:MAG: ArsR/SmtB family transcription factor [Halobacteriales archaeon]